MTTPKRDYNWGNRYTGRYRCIIVKSDGTVCGHKTMQPPHCAGCRRSAIADLRRAGVGYDAWLKNWGERERSYNSPTYRAGGAGNQQIGE